MILLVLFCFRVGVQFIQLVADLPLLPEFDAWHSASISYPVLLGFQLIIIFLSLTVIVRIYHNNYRENYKRSIILLWIGWLYFVFMLIRFLLSITIMQSHVWFGATLPAFFHLVLALFLIVLGTVEKSQLGSRDVSRES